MPAPWIHSPARRRLTATRLVAMLAVLGMAAMASTPTDEIVEHAVPATATRMATLATPAVALNTAAHSVAEPAEPGTVPMATVDDFEMFVPAIDIAAVGFHQGGAGNLRLTPSGEHVVMASRNRGTPPTSAVDVAVGADRTVTAPVTGTVTQVEDYALYGKFTDTLVTIVPEGSDVAVRLMHISDVTVRPGERVTPGQPIAQARRLQMPSQVDRHHDGPAGPHVHIDVSRQ